MVTDFQNFPTTRRPAASPREAPRGVAFIDLEASGLNISSWPVEVGWARGRSEPFSMLVRPDAGWSDEGWDPTAEALHGLSRDRLEAEGLPAAAVAAAVNAALRGCDVYSDAPDWDAFWLYRLFAAARMRPAFSIRSFYELMAPIDVARAEALAARAAELAPRTHRAAADAHHLRTLYRLTCGE